MVLKKVQGLLSRRPGTSASDDNTPTYDQDSPEGIAARGVRLFCESGGPNNSNEEIQYLPEIVTAAESSPVAAEACAYQIRKFLSKDNYSKPHVQYNSIMLIRILTDNPGPTFTRNIDSKFVSTVKDLLRNGRDPSVQQILRETLFSLERDKAYDTNLNPLFHMWRKEYVHGNGGGNGPRTLNAPPFDPSQTRPSGNGDGQSSRRSRGLPSPSELAARIEEARTSAKLLLQLIQSTPPEELGSNDLVKEFGERCQQAQRSIQNYINTATEDSTQADDETMLTLIETNEQLSLALTKHQRAYLAARRTNSSSNLHNNGVTSSSTPTPTPPPPAAAVVPPPAATPPLSPEQTYAPPPNPPPHLQQSLAARESRDSPEADDPFSDSHAANQPHPLEPQHYGTSGIRPGNDFQSTPSYLHRQESADVNRTMHGAATGPEPEVPDVSPVEERRVVYRY
ncbi:GAT domain-containing protein [Lasiodiplodia theobromae]|uniref:Gat domain-containing protein n=1 Tax=Lasiodiplodia theobromae TaxID=45133 RepID=UPI0015C3A8B4|nr:Gat domain-containing protein [Lasiodiplodia theobromae]KAF4535591.1 Gat domain-containing protein [Lasiodiplodia theobromae]KAF9638878.1 GAT domain-containing protein [Lasiodiplodia theobromae]